ncbi:MAG: sensor domain-containing diguanylate cyclase, partial [Nitrospirota bacterium]|nr:sensor domain-containing diguanylate cyclase [Nitrospirota bacterium]
YRTGKPYICEDVASDKLFYSDIREKTSCEIRSLICAPIAIHESVIGVIELINKKGGTHFTENDLALLEIFARYTSTLVQNALDARRFEELSKRDNLTGLYNDRYFLERLPWEVRRIAAQGGDLSIIFLDLDRFKEVNDTYGHLAGSQVLREVAVVVNEVFEGLSAISSRYGGDEFIIILPDTTLKEAGRYAERLRALIAGTIFIQEPLHADAQPLNISGLITASVGVASLTENVERKGDVMDVVGGLIKAADSAMYRAKDLGKNKVVSAKGKI